MHPQDRRQLNGTLFSVAEVWSPSTQDGKGPAHTGNHHPTLPHPPLFFANKTGHPCEASDIAVSSYKEAWAGGQRSRDTAYWEKSRLLPGLSGSPFCSRGPDAPSSQGVRSSQRPLKVCSVALGFPSPCQPSAGPPD